MTREAKVGDLIWSREECLGGAFYHYGMVTSVKPLKASWSHCFIGDGGEVRHFTICVSPSYPLGEMHVVPQPAHWQNCGGRNDAE